VRPRGATAQAGQTPLRRLHRSGSGEAGAGAQWQGKGKRKHKGRPFTPSQRLPDGAVFHVAYDAAKTQWTGTLTIDGKTFTASKGGVFGLLQELDKQYRATVQPAAAGSHDCRVVVPSESADV
jgi:hypothetical protein